MMATDIAEFLGIAIGLSSMFRLPLLFGMAVTGIVTYAILTVEKHGFRPIELIIGGLVAAAALSYVIGFSIADVAWGTARRGTVVPQLLDFGALWVAVGILAATVMLYATYLHSCRTQNRALTRTDTDRCKPVRFSNLEVVIALMPKGLANMAIVIMASGLYRAGHSDVAQIKTAYYTLTPLLGASAADVFLASLLAVDVSSSVLGRMAGQMIMQGF